MLYDVNSPVYLRFTAPKRYAAWTAHQKRILNNLNYEFVALNP
jgi:hypothetical protein